MPALLLWLRADLRLSDHPALTAACASGAPVIPVFILDETLPPQGRIGAAARWWLHHSLAALGESLAKCGSRLILRRGPAQETLMALMAQTGATDIHATHQHEPWWRATDDALTNTGMLTLHHGRTLVPPNVIRNGDGGRYRRFTPWWRALLDHMPPALPHPAPDRIVAPSHWPASEDLNAWALRPTRPNWAGGFDVWSPGEAGARAALRAFLPKIEAYQHRRDRPALDATSRLSPHLQFGEISPATVWHHAAKRAGGDAAPFLRQVAWRDFAMNLLDQFPDYGRVDGTGALAAITWRHEGESERDFACWRQGRTGYPIVDAGMRELWTTGWMHNRVRMICGAFLTRHLLIDWRLGESWFRETLVDASPAINAASWQWVAGSGVDAPPFSRIPAPILQSEKFDSGDYIRRWVPELAGLSDPWIHDPEAFGRRPPAYPPPVIRHGAGRARALTAWNARPAL